MSSPWKRAREHASGIAALVVTGIWLPALLAGFDWWLPFMLFGYILVVPLVAILFEEDEETEPLDEFTPDSQSSNQINKNDVLQTLRDRYARGELTDEEFERKLERLLETETLEDAKRLLHHDERPAERSSEDVGLER